MTKQREAGSLGSYVREKRGRTPVRAAAARVETLSGGERALSEGRWRQVEKGYESKAGLRIPVNPKPDTVAWMCVAVGADISQGLRLAGFDPDDYPDLLNIAPTPAAESEAGTVVDRILAELESALRSRAAADEDGADPVARAILADPTFNAGEKRALLEHLASLRDAPPEPPQENTA